jgi:hypothetical protein
MARVSHAIIIQGYKLHLSRNRLPQSVRMNKEQWVSVLKLSTMWAFDEIREKAIAELSKTNMDTVDKVVLGRSFSVGIWLLEGYFTLVTREAGLTSTEAKRLGYETAFRLCQRREDAFRKAGLRDINKHRSFKHLKEEILQTFRAEFLDAMETESGVKKVGPPPPPPKVIQAVLQCR